ncbi:hypothetical protein L6164_026165 [Bauhinia variegata]|uniref:Uncharacterized protein n=1 Tax=Bauhinia variegata TaxID=167791 RepID=A0ACB9LQ38_BAUVA|nr:hypothetical protein L6164_026165 [Bauhinia variegata]
MDSKNSPDQGMQGCNILHYITNETRFFSYRNSGYQYIHGATNQTGFVKGNGNGIINIKNQRHSEEDVAAELDAFLKLILRESDMGDETRSQPNSSSTTLGGENNFINTVETIEGRANEIGNNDGDNNGNVNWECADK